jgi:hypothetical protein
LILIGVESPLKFLFFSSVFLVEDNIPTGIVGIIDGEF